MTAQSPRQRWERMRARGTPCALPLVDWLRECARWRTDTAVIAWARGEQVPDECIAELEAIVADLRQLVRESAAGQEVA